jgi:hypothetical protein
MLIVPTVTRTKTPTSSFRVAKIAVPAPEPVGHDVVPGLAGVGSIAPVPQEQLYLVGPGGLERLFRLSANRFVHTYLVLPDDPILRRLETSAAPGGVVSVNGITVVEERRQISYLSAFSSDADLPPCRLRARSPGEPGRRRRAAV